MNDWFDNIVKNHYNKALGFKWCEYLVFDLEFRDDHVMANVSDGEELFHVNITFRQFSVHEKDKLKNIADRPEVKLDLLTGTVPDVLFNSGVNIFPASSIDIIVDCDCWAPGMLCNEAFAVLNRLDTIFKYNPFLIFSLRGF